MNTIPLSALELAAASLMVIGLALLSRPLRLGVGRSLLVGGLRTAIQLSLVGLLLKSLFAASGWAWTGLFSLVMLLAAAREVKARQKRPFRGPWAYALGGVSMFLSSFTVTLFALLVLIRPDTWYEPRYSIPLLGMMLGNTMTGIALGLNQLTGSAWRERGSIEARLALGERWQDAIGEIRREAVRTGLIPMVNAMAAAGIVHLPGMMTGQILAGQPPQDAVRYQILIMFMITAGTGLGLIAAVHAGARRLFDDRQRLRLDHLRGSVR